MYFVEDFPKKQYLRSGRASKQGNSRDNKKQIKLSLDTTLSLEQVQPGMTRTGSLRRVLLGPYKHFDDQ